MMLVLHRGEDTCPGLADGLAQRGWQAQVRTQVATRSMRDVRALVAETKPKAVFLASLWDEPEACEAAPDRAFQENAESAIALAAAALEFEAVPILWSPAEIFGQAGGPFSEADRPEPSSIWAESRLKGEKFFLRAAPRGLVVRSGPLVSAPSPQLQQLLASGFEAPQDEEISPLAASALGLILVALLEAGLAGIVHAVGPDAPLSRARFWHQMAQRLGVPARVRPVVARAIAGRLPQGRRAVLASERLGPVLKTPLPSWESVIAAPAASESVASEPHRRVLSAALGLCHLSLKPGERHQVPLGQLYVISGKVVVELGDTEDPGDTEDHLLKPGQTLRISKQGKLSAVSNAELITWSGA